MAIYHLSAKPICRSAGRSSTASAAYRSGCEIADERTGERFDYTRKRGVLSSDLVLPPGCTAWAGNRSALWNAAEASEKRKDACVAREVEVALPFELNPVQRRELALRFAEKMAEQEGCAVDVAIHAPGGKGKNGEEEKNFHAHILRTTRKVSDQGFGAKLDTEQAGRKRADDLNKLRAMWAKLTNDALQQAGIEARVDHRTLEAQGIDRTPTRHRGAAASQFEARTGLESENTKRARERDADNAARLIKREIQALQIERAAAVQAEKLASAERVRQEAAQAAAVVAAAQVPVQAVAAVQEAPTTMTIEEIEAALALNSIHMRHAQKKRLDANPLAAVKAAKALVQRLTAEFEKLVPRIKLLKLELGKLASWRPKKYTLKKEIADLERRLKACRESLAEAKVVANSPIYELVHAKSEKLKMELAELQAKRLAMGPVPGVKAQPGQVNVPQKKRAPGPS